MVGWIPLVALDWSSSKLKVLSVFISVGDLEADNWRPRIDAVERVLNSWRSRSLSFRGKALVVNALALSRVWYVASLVHMPPWALKELSSLAFSFFWSGKCELVLRSVVLQPSLFGGFSVVDVKLKVWPLFDQWVRRFTSSSSGWVSFMSFGFNFHFGLTFILVPPLLTFFPSCIPITPGSCHPSIGLFFFLGAVWMGLFRCLVMPSSMARLPLMSVPLCQSRVPRPVTCSFCPKVWSLHIVW